MIYDKQYVLPNGKLKLKESKSLKWDKQAKSNWTAITTYFSVDNKPILEDLTFGINQPELTEFPCYRYELSTIKVFEKFFFLTKEHLTIQDNIPKSIYDLYAFDYTGKNLYRKTSVQHKDLDKEIKSATFKLIKSSNKSQELTK